jgi:hypothetical protein
MMPSACPAFSRMTESLVFFDMRGLVNAVDAGFAASVKRQLRLHTVIDHSVYSI